MKCISKVNKIIQLKGFSDFKTVIGGIFDTETSAAVAIVKIKYAATPSARKIKIINTKSKIIFVRGSSLCKIELPGKN